MRIVHGLMIRGLSWDTGSAATLFVDGPIDAATIPAGYGPLTGCQVVSRLVPGSVTGGTITNTLRDPLGQGSIPTCKLIDDGTAPTFTRLFAADPAYRITQRWAAYDIVRLTSADTSLRLRGNTPPPDDVVVYLNGEAISCVLRTTESANTWQFDMSRGLCGSRALTHSLLPSQIPPGDPGSKETLMVSSRPENWEAFEAILVRFKMSEAAPNSVASVDWVWDGTLDKAPTFDAKTRTWTVGVAHDVKRIREWSFGGAKDIETERCVIIRHVSQSPQFTPRPGMPCPNLRWPGKIQLRLSLAESERLTEVWLGQAQSALFDSSLVAELNTFLSLSTLVEWELSGEVGGYHWTWQVDSIVYNSERLISLYGSLLAAGDGADISDKPMEFPAAVLTARGGGANAGFILYEAPHAFMGDSDAVRRDLQEAPPKLTFRARIRADWVTASLIRLTSGFGGQRNGVYDLLVGGRGPQLDPASLNIDVAPADAWAVDEGTTKLLELASQEEEEHFALAPGDNLGDWLRNSLLVNCCSWGYLPSTGQMTARRLARRPGARASIRTMVGAENMVSSRERITGLKVLMLGRGIDPITLEVAVKKAVQLPEGRAKDYANALLLRLWNQGGLFSDAELTSGPLGRLFRWLFGSSMGSPQVWDIKVPVEQLTVIFGDQLLLTDPTLPTASGFGVTDLGVVVISPPDQRAEDGIQTVRVIEDVYNNETTAGGTQPAQTGVIPPRLKIEGIVNNPSAGRYLLHVTSVDAQAGFDITTAASLAYNDMVTNSSRLKILYAGSHNPVATNERKGPLEASGQVLGITYSGGRSYLDIVVDAPFARGGFVLTDIVRRGAYVLFQELVQATNTPTGTPLQGDTAQDRFPGGLRLTHPKRVSLNGVRHLIGA